jgi:hypothetical protein
LQGAVGEAAFQGDMKDSRRACPPTSHGTAGHDRDGQVAGVECWNAGFELVAVVGA